MKMDNGKKLRLCLGITAQQVHYHLKFIILVKKSKSDESEFGALLKKSKTIYH
jgi:hypothetical protein